MGDSTNIQCQKCGSPAWVGAYNVLCINANCRHFDPVTREMWTKEWVAKQASPANRITKPASITIEPFDWENDDTLPGVPLPAIGTPPDKQLVDDVADLVDKALTNPDITGGEAEALLKWYKDTVRDYLQAQICANLCAATGLGPKDSFDISTPEKYEQHFAATKKAVLDALRTLIKDF